MPSPIVTDNDEFGSLTAHNDDNVDSEAVMPLGPELPIGDLGGICVLVNSPFIPPCIGLTTVYLTP